MKKAHELNKKLNTEEKINGKTVLQSSPIRISMNMTGKCNIRCVYCHLTFADYYSKDELDVYTFSKVSKILPELSHLVFFSSTEPLMAKHFDSIFDYSSEFENEKYLSTNGILISKSRAKKFIENKLEYLTVSFGGLNKQSFIEAHQVDKLDEVLKNLKYLNNLKKEMNSEFPKVRLVFVTWKENAHELPEAVKLAKELDCKEGVKITFLKAYDDNLIDSIPFKHKQYVNKYVREAQRLGKELDVKVDFDGGELDESVSESDTAESLTHRKCFEPWERMHIEADGNVRTCPALANNIVAGNLNENSIEEIWNGEVFQNFRRTTNSDNPPEPCKRCTHNFHKNFEREDVWDQRDLDLGIYKRLENKNYIKKSNRYQSAKSVDEWTSIFMDKEEN